MAPDHDRLQESLASDALGKLRKLLRCDFAPRLIGARLDQVNLNLKVSRRMGNLGGWRRKGRLARGYQATESAAQSGFLWGCHVEKSFGNGLFPARDKQNLTRLDL
jgi:hypothetical protein